MCLSITLQEGLKHEVRLAFQNGAIGTGSRLSLPFPWSRTYRELRNA